MKNIIRTAINEYEKEIRRIAENVKRGTRKSHPYRDDLEPSMRKAEGRAGDKIEELDISYNEKWGFVKMVGDALLEVDRKYFGCRTPSGSWYYDFVNGTDAWKKLIE